MNPAYRSSMEDVTVVYPNLKDKKDVFFAALMDGHGGIAFLFYYKNVGCATASFVASRIGDNLYDALQVKEFSTMEDVLRYTFLYTDVECRYQNLMASGCTCASVTIVYNEQTNERTLYSANIGDSRVLLYSNGVVTRLSYVYINFLNNLHRITKLRMLMKSIELSLLEVW